MDERFGVLISRNSGFHAAWQVSGTFEQMRLKLEAETVEAVPWEISNHQKGLIWLDEHGKRKKRQPCGALYKKAYPDGLRYSAEDLLMGPLLFTGPDTQAGQVELLSAKDALALQRWVNSGGSCRVMGFWFSIKLPMNRLIQR